MLLATHAPDVAAAAHRIVHMRDGRIESAGAGRPTCGCLAGSSCGALVHEPLRSVLTALGIALGVAVVVWRSS